MEVILIKQPFEVSFSGNPMPFVFAITPYTDAEKARDVRLGVQILVEQSFGSGIFTEIKSQNYYAGNDGTITIDVAPVLHPYLEYYTPRPTLARPVQAIHQRKRYKVAYSLTEDSAVIVAATDSAIGYAIKGGMAYDQWHPSEFFTSLISDSKKALHFPAAKETVRLQDLLFLFWTYPNNDNAAQSLRFRVYLEDGNDYEYTSDHTVICGKWGICCAPVGYIAAGLTDELNALLQFAFPFTDTSLIVSYSVSVVVGDAVIVAPVTYKIEKRNFYKEYKLLFRNSVGGMQLLSLRGQVDFAADYDRQSAQRTIPPAYYQNLILQAAQTQINTEQPKNTGDTGFLSEEAMLRLRDLMLTQQVYEVDTAALRFYPTIVSVKTAKFFSNKDNLLSMQVDFQRAYTNDYYTPKGLMPATRACPAMENFTARQLNKTTLQFFWSLPIPYDQVQVQLIIGGVTKIYTYSGNSGTVKQTFENPATTDPVDITIKARVICDGNENDYGTFTTLTLSVVGNYPPVAVNDNYSINAGYNTPVTLPGSALANDYDPDNDPIEVVAASGSTHDGGSYAIDAAGIISYTPPTSGYTGIDYFDYHIRNVGGTPTVTGRVFINVGGTVTVFARLVLRNTNVSYATYYSSGSGEVWFDFFSNPQGTIPLDVTGLGLNVNWRQSRRDYDGTGAFTDTNTDSVASNPAGNKVMVFSGTWSDLTLDPVTTEDTGYVLSFFLLPGSVYQVI